jgi:F-type H+-transporting ATPase subunit c
MLTPMLAQAGEAATQVSEVVARAASHNLAVGLGAALGVGFIGMKASEAVGRNPGAATPILVQAILAIAFAEAIVFYAIFLVKG